jgi:hypothetical protein
MRCVALAGAIAAGGASSGLGQPAAIGASTAGFQRITIGPGLVDTSVREIVRNTSDVVYVFLADDTAERTGTGPGVIRAWKANQPGLPTAFAEVDGAHRPSSSGSTHVLGAPDVRLDRTGVAHLLYANEADGTLVYQTFSTVTDTWGPASVLATGVTVPSDQAIKRSETAYALALDANDEPQIVYMAGGTVFYRADVAGTWSSPTPIATATRPIHPSAAIDASGAFHVAWLDDGVAPTIDYARRAPDGTWSSDEVVASGDVLSNANHDQAPSLIVTPPGTPYVLYDSANPTSAARVKYRTSAGWVLDGPSYDLYNHAPALYSQNDDLYLFVGHDVDLNYGYAYHVSGADWSGYTKLTADRADGSASIRWDPARDNNPNVIDTTFYDENSTGTNYIPLAYYMAITPAQSSSDTTAPTVAVTSPTNGTSVTGAVTVAATASDNVGVTSVQFKVDGSNIGSVDTSAPYSTSWDTTTATTGSHTLTAVARDAAGNTTTSAAVSITVANPPSPPAGGVLLGDQTVESNRDSDAAGQAEAFRVVASASGTISSIDFFVDAVSSATSIRVGMYSDNGGHPGTLLTAGSTATPLAGLWNRVDVQSADVVAGHVYWIAVLAPIGAGTLQFRDHGPGGQPTETNADRSLGSLPSAWQTGTSYGDGLLSAYATVGLVADTTPPTVSITAPADGTVLCGAVTASADASDNAGVASVQFRLDGQDLGPALTAPPYALSWDASTLTSGSHVLTAVAVDAAGNQAASAPVTIQVSCPPPSVPTPTSLFSATLVPASTGLPVQDGRAGVGPWSDELGMKFTVTAPVSLTALRFYKDAAESGTHLGHLWTSSGEQLAQVAFSGETASGWQQQSLASPIVLQPGTTYVASVGINDTFVLTYGGLATAITAGPLTSVADGANGVFGSSAGTFPTHSYKSSNYFVDVVVQ